MPGGAGARSGVTARELLVLIAGACLLVVVMHWPLVLHLETTIPRDLGDPLAEAWQVAWDGHALADQPLHFFQSNQFWPFHDTLAFSDALLGYAPAGLLGSGPGAAVARYDLLFLFAYALAFAGAYLLGRELGLGPGGAAVAGAAFAFAPYRLEQDGHMQVISSGGIPLAFALGVRGYRRRRLGWLFAGWAIAAWQLSLGFTLGLPLAYLLASLWVAAALIWLRLDRPRLDRGLAVATLAGAAIFVLAGIVLSRPYIRVADEHPEARRTPAEVEPYSGPPWIFLVAPEENLAWGGATAPLRDDLSNIPEKTLFPGLAILTLAIVGLSSPAYPRWLRRGLGVGVVVISVLALGFRESGGVLWPYRLVYDLLPGWDAIRVPGRLVVFSSLGLALLAGAGAQRAMRRSERWIAARWGPAAVAAVAVLAIAVEGRGLPFDPFDNQAQPRVPVPPPSISAIPAPQLHLPAERPCDNRRYILWSTEGFPKLVNGRSSFQPAFTARLIKRMRSFPDRGTAARLSRLGVRSVILHTSRARGTPLEGAAKRPVEGLPISRRRRDGLVVYVIRSPSGDEPGRTRLAATRSVRSSR
jgi:MFS family permease